MSDVLKNFDLVIIGAGPVGIAAAVQAKRQRLSAIILEKGVVANSIFHYPTNMTFFTTADLLEVGGHPFPSTNQKPSRMAALDYYRGVVKNEQIKVMQHHVVQDILGDESNFTIKGQYKHRGRVEEFTYLAKYVIVAIGYFDNPNGLGGVPGEFGENVLHQYTEPHPFYDHDVIVIGAGNSGAEASLDLWRHGARVTLVHKHPEPRSTIKYWVKPDLKNRLKEGNITGIMPAETKEIRPDGVLVDHEGEEKFLEADFVFILTGYRPDVGKLRKWNLELSDEDFSVTLLDNYESTRKGLFVVGSAGAGKETNRVFIENGREHAVIAVDEIAKRLHCS